ncbi:adenosylcobinamide-gdp ribazoletransferase [Lucifera butyrica]|uniref:Adenosylcobinamide-GDP ribazoletransferase n=1 Tax=Lucifera butyrica TaxID=1351585 RepID=A0A498R379_9FIRM|nr:adenosylcobinamide-GDP ribazoletransferase [Lucifera butyrica]VBB05287.1 adenosylcobinamide-gdp ribazoletransferase [Lucifera butyrica]
MRGLLAGIFQDFVTGLQFLTRLRIFAESEWSPERFGRSVRLFPLIGAVVGSLLAALYGVFSFLREGRPPLHVMAVSLVLADILLTGGMHWDGLMDTMDGLLCGQSREDTLAIMKDSRVGSGGVMAFAVIIFSKVALLMAMNQALLPIALFSMPVAGRMAMVIGVSLFPYARSKGLGKDFAVYSGRKTCLIAGLLSLSLLGPLGPAALAGLAAAAVFAILFARHVAGVLGGLTGDVYGAVKELSEVVCLAAYLLFLQ